jgi:hypothetical protein
LLSPSVRGSCAARRFQSRFTQLPRPEGSSFFWPFLWSPWLSFAVTPVTATYTFTSAGAYVVTLTVGDGSATDAASRTVSCQVKGRKLRCS